VIRAARVVIDLCSRRRLRARDDEIAKDAVASEISSDDSARRSRWRRLIMTKDCKINTTSGAVNTLKIARIHAKTARQRLGRWFLRIERE
jgi:hypothetical protein